MTMESSAHSVSSAPAMPAATAAPASLVGWLGALWGIAGVSLLLLSAITRLSPRALEALTGGLDWLGWAVLVPWTLFMVFSEGYRGFQQGFSPRVAARARWLGAHPTATRVVLAPLFCMGFFQATRRRLITTWCLTTGIVGLILLVSLLPQPWRGIVDFGVVAGLLWGLVALWIFAAQAFFGSRFHWDPELGGSAAVANTPG